MHKISGLIICRNEEKNIEECLKSILWCDEIILIDAFSKDKTSEIAKQYTNKIFQNEWKGFAEQRKFALTKVNYDWVFSLDADERCSKELSEEIKSLLSKESIKENGFEVPRKSFFLNKWIKHCGWYPDEQLRLFKKEFASVKDRLVHEGFEITGLTGKLKNDIIHYTVNSISEFVNRVNHYSTLSSLEKKDKSRITFLNLLFTPFIAFIQKFFFQMGFLDGVHGMMVSYFHSITKTLTYMKIFEMQNKK